MPDIRVLDPILSSRIAAGEVIERPQSVIRELLDNSIDAGATEIDISLEGGGIDRIEFADNGSGIKREDFENIAKRHSTSKISKLDDLYSISTLGFRGEALYSIGAVSSLTIESKTKDEKHGFSLNIDNGRRGEIKERELKDGTRIIIEDLFSEIPARRSFLKRNSTESQLSRNLIVNKALAFPNVRFILKIDGALRLDWPQVSSLKERVSYLYRQDGIADQDVNVLRVRESDYSIEIIAGNSSVSRSDKKEIRVYVNNRPIDDYGITQAVTYGFGEMLPGGKYPYAAVFIYDKPELVDFNIHPAKREAKLRNRADIHHSITTLLRGVERKIPEIESPSSPYYIRETPRWEMGERTSTFSSNKESCDRGQIEFSYSLEKRSRSDFKEKEASWLEKAKELQELRRERDRDKGRERYQKEGNSSQHEDEGQQKKREEEAPDEIPFTYIGQAFRLFLIAQKGESLYFVDQHAAHERIIYDELIEKKTVQPLLVPIRLEVEDDVDEFLEKNSHIYTKLGIMISKCNKGSWQIDALPAVCRDIEDQIENFIKNAKADEIELEQNLFSIIACKAAIKSGDEIDKFTANAILERVFKMENPSCPHGRTFLVRITDKRLKELVGRNS